MNYSALTTPRLSFITLNVTYFFRNYFQEDLRRPAYKLPGIEKKIVSIISDKIEVSEDWLNVVFQYCLHSQLENPDIFQLREANISQKLPSHFASIKWPEVRSDPPHTLCSLFHMAKGILASKLENLSFSILRFYIHGVSASWNSLNGSVVYLPAYSSVRGALSCRRILF